METSQFWALLATLLVVWVSTIGSLIGAILFLTGQMNRQISGLRAEMNQGFTELRADMTRAITEQKADTNRQFTELREDMNRQFSEQKDALAEQKDATNRQFSELRDDMNRRFNEQGARMDRMEARLERTETQHGELVGEVHRMGKRLGRIDMMLELLTQRRPSVRQMFRRRAADAA